MRKQEYQGKRTSREYLVLALIALMEGKSIHKITVKELCSKAGINRSTFYSNFFDLEDFYNQVMHQAVKGLVDAVTGNGTSAEMLLSRDKPFTCYVAWFTHVRDSSDIFRVFLGPNGTQEFRELLYRQGVEWYTQLLKPIMPRFEDKVSIDALANYIVSAHMGLLTFYIESNMKYSVEYMAEQLVLLTFSGPFSILGLFSE